MPTINFQVTLANAYRHITHLGLPLPLSDPILFYTYACFVFASILVFSVFLLAWHLPHPTTHGTGAGWVTGMLAAAWLFSNFEDSTRAHFTVNLREGAALPFFFAQNVFLVKVLRGGAKLKGTAGSIWWLEVFYLAMVTGKFHSLTSSSLCLGGSERNVLKIHHLKYGKIHF